MRFFGQRVEMRPYCVGLKGNPHLNFQLKSELKGLYFVPCTFVITKKETLKCFSANDFSVILKYNAIISVVFYD